MKGEEFMSTKAKKESTKKAPGAATKSDAKTEKKSAKPAAAEEIDVEEVIVEKAPGTEEPAVDLDELEEQEELAAAEASSSGGNAAALAAASGSTEMSASFKNFRHHPDMENFYRFIYENDLRHEALAIIDEIMVDKQQRKLGKPAGKTH
jgi:hypothetical protein